MRMVDTFGWQNKCTDTFFFQFVWAEHVFAVFRWKTATLPRSSFCKQAAKSQHRAITAIILECKSLFWVKNKQALFTFRFTTMSKYEVKTNLRLLRTLLRPTDESIFIGLPVSEAINLRVRSQRTFIVNVAATNSANTPCVHWLTAVLYFSHSSKEANRLARNANVSELVDRYPNAKVLLCLCCCMKYRWRHDFSTSLSKYSLEIYNTTTVKTALTMFCLGKRGLDVYSALPLASYGSELNAKLARSVLPTQPI